MATFVLVHASFKGGWCWKQVARLLRAQGHEVYTPTLTGLGERSHLTDREINLELHVQDIVNVLFYEDLKEVVLVGHSYAGMVITEVAGRVPERLAGLVYLDAYLPTAGQTEYDLWPDSEKQIIKTELARGGKTRVPPPVELLGITDQTLREWISPRMVAQPIATYTQPVTKGDVWKCQVPSAYILCTEGPLAPFMRVFAEAARMAGWPVRELVVGHDAMISAPATLADALNDLASRPVQVED